MRLESNAPALPYVPRDNVRRRLEMARRIAG
jgi:hypothetical protein